MDLAPQRTLDTVLADWRSRASAARRAHAEHEAALIDEIADDVSRAAEPFIAWIPESDAMLASGKSRAWLRSRFPRWEADGHARWAPQGRRVRQYRQIILPRRYDAEAVKADARAAARADDRRMT